MTSINGVQIFRELGERTPQNILDWLELRGQLFTVVDPKKNEHLFIDNDLPRDVEITDAIMASTIGFALFDDEGEYIGSYRSLDRAAAAQAGAKRVVKADLDMDDAPDEDVLEAE